MSFPSSELPPMPAAPEWSGEAPAQPERPADTSAPQTKSLRDLMDRKSPHDFKVTRRQWDGGASSVQADVAGEADPSAARAFVHREQAVDDRAKAFRHLEKKLSKGERLDQEEQVLLLKNLVDSGPDALHTSVLVQAKAKQFGYKSVEDFLAKHRVKGGQTVAVKDAAGEEQLVSLERQKEPRDGGKKEKMAGWPPLVKDAVDDLKKGGVSMVATTAVTLFMAPAALPAALGIGAAATLGGMIAKFGSRMLTREHLFRKQEEEGSAADLSLQEFVQAVYAAQSAARETLAKVEGGELTEEQKVSLLKRQALALKDQKLEQVDAFGRGLRGSEVVTALAGIGGTAAGGWMGQLLTANLGLVQVASGHIQKLVENAKDSGAAHLRDHAIKLIRGAWHFAEKLGGANSDIPRVGQGTIHALREAAGAVGGNYEAFTAHQMAEAAAHSQTLWHGFGAHGGFDLRTELTNAYYNKWEDFIPTAVAALTTGAQDLFAAARTQREAWRERKRADKVLEGVYRARALHHGPRVAATGPAAEAPAPAVSSAPEAATEASSIAEPVAEPAPEAGEGVPAYMEARARVRDFEREHADYGAFDPRRGQTTEQFRQIREEVGEFSEGEPGQRVVLYGHEADLDAMEAEIERLRSLRPEDPDNPEGLDGESLVIKAYVAIPAEEYAGHSERTAPSPRIRHLREGAEGRLRLYLVSDAVDLGGYIGDVVASQDPDDDLGVIYRQIERAEEDEDYSMAPREGETVLPDDSADQQPAGEIPLEGEARLTSERARELIEPAERAEGGLSELLQGSALTPSQRQEIAAVAQEVSAARGDLEEVANAYHFGAPATPQQLTEASGRLMQAFDRLATELGPQFEQDPEFGWLAHLGEAMRGERERDGDERLEEHARERAAAALRDEPTREQPQEGADDAIDRLVRSAVMAEHEAELGRVAERLRSLLPADALGNPATDPNLRRIAEIAERLRRDADQAHELGSPTQGDILRLEANMRSEGAQLALIRGTGVFPDGSEESRVLQEIADRLQSKRPS